MGKSFWIVLSVVILAAIGLIFFAPANDDTASTTENSDTSAVVKTDHRRGLDGSSITLIKYLDFQCPPCAAISPIVDLMYQEFGDRVEFVARSFSIVGGNSMFAHRAAEAAAVQGSYWEMYDLLFQRQQSWARSTDATSVFEGYAIELGLNLNKYKEDVVSQEVLDRISADKDSGRKADVRGTPTFLLNGVQIPVPRSVEEFQTVLQAAIDEAGSPVEAQ